MLQAEEQHEQAAQACQARKLDVEQQGILVQIAGCLNKAVKAKVLKATPDESANATHMFQAHRKHSLFFGMCTMYLCRMDLAPARNSRDPPVICFRICHWKVSELLWDYPIRTLAQNTVAVFLCLKTRLVISLQPGAVAA
jgi:hypothetical protein